MSKTNRLVAADSFHQDAMRFAEMAMLPRWKHRPERLAFLRCAFELERDAADLMASTDLEPTRSVLHRSAAALAIDVGERKEALRLIDKGLSGSPPFEIECELRDLRDSL